MKREIEKILEKHKEGKIITWKAVNEILRLSIVRNNEVTICALCKEHILMADGTCPDCTIALCTPLEQTDF